MKDWVLQVMIIKLLLAMLARGDDRRAGVMYSNKDCKRNQSKTQHLTDHSRLRERKCGIAHEACEEES